MLNRGYITPQSRSLRYRYSSPTRVDWGGLYRTYYEDYRARSPYRSGYYAEPVGYESLYTLEEQRRRQSIYDEAYANARANYDYEGKLYQDNQLNL